MVGSLLKLSAHCPKLNNLNLPTYIIIPREGQNVQVLIDGKEHIISQETLGIKQSIAHKRGTKAELTRQYLNCEGLHYVRFI